MGELCCCPICGRIIDYWQYHKNDIESEYKGYCYGCENYILKETNNGRRRNKAVYTDGCK